MASTIQLSLATALPTYRPGETITALLLASTSLPEDIELQVVDVQFTGIERVDTSWVSPAYRKDIPTINNDRRRVQRHVLHTALQAATQGTFADSNIRRFLIRYVHYTRACAHTQHVLYVPILTTTITTWLYTDSHYRRGSLQHSKAPPFDTAITSKRNFHISNSMKVPMRVHAVPVPTASHSRLPLPIPQHPHNHPHNHKHHSRVYHS